MSEKSYLDINFVIFVAFCKNLMWIQTSFILNNVLNLKTSSSEFRADAITILL